MDHNEPTQYYNPVTHTVTADTINRLRAINFSGGACINTAMSYGLDCHNLGVDCRVIIARCINYMTDKPYVHCWVEVGGVAVSLANTHVDGIYSTYDAQQIRQDLQASVIANLDPTKVKQWWHGHTISTINRAVAGRLPKRYLKLLAVNAE